MNFKRNNFAAIGLIVAATGVFALSSCVNKDYDLTNIDETIKIGENGLTLPLGATETLTLEKLLDEESRKYVQELPDGRMAILSFRKDDFSNKIPDISSRVEPLSSVNISENKQFPIVMPNPSKFELPIEYKTGIEFIATDIFPSEVKSVDKITFKDTYLNIDLTINNLPDLGVPVNVEFDIFLPGRMKTSDPRVDSRNVLHISQNYNGGSISISPIKVESLDMKDAHYPLVETLTIKGKLSAEKPTVAPGSVSGKNARFSVLLTIPDPMIEKVEGKVDYNISEIGQNISLDGLPNLMKGEGFSLDVVDPHIELLFLSNTGVPVKGNITVIPFVNDEPLTENTITITGFGLPASNSAENVRTTKIWISDENTNVPQDCQWLKASISKILRIIPDYIQVKVNASSDTSSKETHVVEPNANYSISLEHTLVIPMQFGENLKVALKDTLRDVPSEISDVLNTGSLMLGGNVETTLPINMKLTLRLLDSQNNEIPMKDVVSQDIASSTSPGVASVTDLNLNLALKEGVTADDISCIELTFLATSPGKTNLPITNNSYLKAKLNARFPNGLILENL